jgi:hypothetical protein
MNFEILPKDFILYKSPTHANVFYKTRKAPSMVPYKLVKSIKVKSEKIKSSKVYLKNPSSLLKQFDSSVQKARHKNITKLFLEFSKGTKRLLNDKRMVLGGGMAVKIHLQYNKASMSKVTAKTDDFDFHYISSGEKNVLRDSHIMCRIMWLHLNWFSKFLNSKHGFKSSILMRELKGVPVDKIGEGYKRRKVYKVFRFYIVTPSKNIEFVDLSLVKGQVVPTDIISGIRLPKFVNLWKDVAYTLTSSFIEPKSFLRNPLVGSKKRKGLKDVARISNLLMSRGIRNRKVLIFLRDILKKNVVKSRQDAISLRRQLTQTQRRRVQRKPMLRHKRLME